MDIQKIFIKLLEEKLDRIEGPEEKKELMQFFSILRYYNFILFDEERFIKDIEPIEEDMSYIEEKTIERLYTSKVLNNITKDVETDIKIIRPILTTRIMNIENIYIHVWQNERTLEVNIYDGKILELEFEIENSRDVQIKGKKKIKLFN